MSHSRKNRASATAVEGPTTAPEQEDALESAEALAIAEAAGALVGPSRLTSPSEHHLTDDTAEATEGQQAEATAHEAGTAGTHGEQGPGNHLKGGVRPRRNMDNGVSVGERVVGRVVWANEHGAKVEIMDSMVTGYMPANEAPCMVSNENDELMSPTPAPGQPCVPVGLTREFEVVRNDSKRGPRLSARSLDWDLLWYRARQLYEASRQERENVRIKVVDVNTGGLLARAGGLQLFVPVSQLVREEGNTWWSEEELRAQFTGRELEVAVHEIEPSRRKFVGSVVVGAENKAVRQIKVGSLVWGTVRRVEPFGVFVGIDDTHTSGLMHISNISRSRVRRVDDIFAIGDRVHCLVMGIDEGYTNISLSTAELEVEDGDMLTDPAKVYENAQEQQEYFLQHLEFLRQDLVESDDWDGHTQQSGSGDYLRVA